MPTLFAGTHNEKVLQLPAGGIPVNSSHGELVTGDQFTVAFFHFCDEFTV